MVYCAMNHLHRKGDWNESYHQNIRNPLPAGDQENSAHGGSDSGAGGAV